MPVRVLLIRQGCSDLDEAEHGDSRLDAPARNLCVHPPGCLFSWFSRGFSPSASWKYILRKEATLNFKEG